MIDSKVLLDYAVRKFWQGRQEQLERQGATTGIKDTGNRAAVTGGRHADGFIELIHAIVHDAGLDKARIEIERGKALTLPGFFRPAKAWDVVVTSEQHLVAVIEVKTQVGSFGNNFNNRVEEAIGSATDFWIAYREGLLMKSQRPWLGYFFMMEDAPESTERQRRVRLRTYAVDEAFQTRSYIQRYELTCLRLVRERLYDAACFVTSDKESGLTGTYREPNPELGISNFARSLYERVRSFVNVV